MSEKFYGQLRMKQLPKSEYFLMKDIMSAFRLDDERECFIVGMRLLYTLLHNDKIGKGLVTAVISEWRASQNVEREYTKVREILK